MQDKPTHTAPAKVAPNSNPYDAEVINAAAQLATVTTATELLQSLINLSSTTNEPQRWELKCRHKTLAINHPKNAHPNQTEGLQVLNLPDADVKLLLYGNLTQPTKQLVKSILPIIKNTTQRICKNSWSNLLPDSFENELHDTTETTYIWNPTTNQLQIRSSHWEGLKTIAKNQKHHWDNWIEKEHQDQLKNSLSNCIENNNTYFELEHPLQLENQKNHWVLNRAKLTYDTTGQLLVVGRLININHVKQLEQSLKFREEFQHILLSLATEFINFPADDINPMIDHTLSVIGEFFKTDRSYLFQFDPRNPDVLNNTHEWCQTDIAPQKDQLQGLPKDALPWWMAKMRNYEIIHIPDVANMPPEAEAEQQILAEQDIKSLIVVPVVSEKLLGFVGFDAVKSHKKWSQDSVYLLSVVGELLANAITRVTLDKEITRRKVFQKAILDTLPFLVWQKDKNLRFEAVNANFIEESGLTEEQILGKTDADIWPKELAMSYMSDEALVLQQGSPINTEEELKTTNGLRWVETFKYPLFDENGEVAGTTGFARDITDRKNHEKQLKDSERRFREFAQLLPEMVCEADINGKITFANDYAYNRFGYSQADFDKGVTVVELFHPDDRQRAMSNFKKRLEGADMPGFEYNAINKSQTEVFPVMVYVNVVEHNGNPIGLRGVMVDITEKKLQEEELRKAKLRAEEISYQKSTFLANMSHEIRTPMNGVIGLTNLLARTQLNQQQTEYCHMIEQSGKALLGLINDILDISKIESGKIELEKKPFDLKRTFNELLQTFEIRVSDKNLALKSQLPKNLPAMVVGDELRLRQILYNLLGNAIKFTNKGHVALHLRQLKPRKPNHATIKITVSDTGVGIIKAHQQKIFSAFDQADVSTTRKYGGTGLGLAICRSLAQLMGSDIEVSSQPGKGSRFSLTLTLPIAHNNTQRLTVKTPRPKNIPALKTLNILVAEDYPINQKYIETLLKLKNHKTTMATNGEEAVKACQNGTFDCILMDVQMPEMDGMEATAIIREMENYANTPIIALTASALKGDKESFLKGGMDDYISKPVDEEKLDQLLTAIANHQFVSLRLKESLPNTQILIVKTYLENSKIRGLENTLDSLTYIKVQLEAKVKFWNNVASAPSPVFIGKEMADLKELLNPLPLNHLPHLLNATSKNIVAEFNATFVSIFNKVVAAAEKLIDDLERTELYLKSNEPF